MRKIVIEVTEDMIADIEAMDWEWEEVEERVQDSVNDLLYELTTYSDNE